jgi:hypothetical protein
MPTGRTPFSLAGGQDVHLLQVPNRLNYVLWIQDLVREILDTRLWAGDGDTGSVRGLDV